MSFPAGRAVHRDPSAHQAFFDLNRDLRSTLRSRVGEIPRLRRFACPVRIVFGASDPYLKRPACQRRGGRPTKRGRTAPCRADRNGSGGRTNSAVAVGARSRGTPTRPLRGEPTCPRGGGPPNQFRPLVREVDAHCLRVPRLRYLHKRSLRPAVRSVQGAGSSASSAHSHMRSSRPFRSAVPS
jgi:hypothetical protein